MLLSPWHGLGLSMVWLGRDCAIYSLCIITNCFVNIASAIKRWMVSDFRLLLMLQVLTAFSDCEYQISWIFCLVKLIELGIAVIINDNHHPYHNKRLLLFLKFIRLCNVIISNLESVEILHTICEHYMSLVAVVENLAFAVRIAVKYLLWSHSSAIRVIMK